MQVQGTIQRCRFINIASDFTYPHAFGAPLVRWNTVIQSVPPKRCAQEGFYLEPQDSNSNNNYMLLIEKNTFNGVGKPLHILTHPDGTTGNVTFRNNTCFLPDAPSTNAVSLEEEDPVAQLPRVHSMTIVGNRFMVQGLTDRTEAPLGRGIDLAHGKYYIDSVSITHNMFSPSVPSRFEIQVYRNPMYVGRQVISGNTYTNGKPVNATGE